MSSPFSAEQIRAEVAQEIVRCPEYLRTYFERVKVEPARWRDDPFYDEFGGNWVVAVEGMRAIAWREIEGGFDLRTIRSQGELAPQDSMDQLNLLDALWGLRCRPLRERYQADMDLRWKVAHAEFLVGALLPDQAVDLAIVAMLAGEDAREVVALAGEPFGSTWREISETWHAAVRAREVPELRGDQAMPFLLHQLTQEVLFGSHDAFQASAEAASMDGGTTASSEACQFLGSTWYWDEEIWHAAKAGEYGKPRPGESEVQFYYRKLQELAYADFMEWFFMRRPDGSFID